MRYHYEKPEIYVSNYGETYICDHPVYDRCTLFKIGDKGLSVIQQRFNTETKEKRWTEIDPWLTDAIYLNKKFRQLFETHSSSGTLAATSNNSDASTIREVVKNVRSKSTKLLYPTLTVRQVMWALKMKPLRRERWETVFDRKDI